MGRLVYLADLDLDARWYFPDAHYVPERNIYSYEWPNSAYQYKAAIHSDDFDNHNDRRIEIRKWIEENIVETVICDVLDKSYRLYYHGELNWKKSYQMPNEWVIFYFENEYSASIFSLRFSEWIKPITDEHPSYI